MPRGPNAATITTAPIYDGITSGSDAAALQNARPGRSVRLVSQASGTAMAIVEIATAPACERTSPTVSPVLPSRGRETGRAARGRSVSINLLHQPSVYRNDPLTS